jgi:hypothetical protein
MVSIVANDHDDETVVTWIAPDAYGVSVNGETKELDTTTFGVENHERMVRALRAASGEARANMRTNGRN